MEESGKQDNRGVGELITSRSVLVLSPHTDDGEIGCGGTIAKLIDIGAEVRCIAFSYADDTRLKDEMEGAMDVLGIANYEILDYKRRIMHEKRQEILDYIILYLKQYTPDLIFTPTSTDTHQDHQVITNEALRASKQSSILGYVMPWNTINFQITGYVALDEKHVKKKQEATACYKSQAGRPVFADGFTLGMLRTFGASIGVRYAEAFEVLKLVL